MKEIKFDWTVSTDLAAHDAIAIKIASFTSSFPGIREKSGPQKVNKKLKHNIKKNNQMQNAVSTKSQNNKIHFFEIIK